MDIGRAMSACLAWLATIQYVVLPAVLVMPWMEMLLPFVRMEDGHMVLHLPVKVRSSCLSKYEGNISYLNVAIMLFILGICSPLTPSMYGWWNDTKCMSWYTYSFEGQVCNLTCRDGYAATGSNLVCESGSWIGAMPGCKGKIQSL